MECDRKKYRKHSLAALKRRVKFYVMITRYFNSNEIAGPKWLIAFLKLKEAILLPKRQ